MKLPLVSAFAAAALALTGCATTPGSANGYGGYGYGNPPASNPATCYDCGTVTRIEMGSGSRVPNATGAVVGGVIGAAAAREVAKDRTDSQGRQNTATVAGAVAGAAIGNAIQNRTGTGYNVYVRMNDGRQVVVSQDDLGGLREGSYVRVVNGRALLR